MSTGYYAQKSPWSLARTSMSSCTREAVSFDGKEEARWFIWSPKMLWTSLQTQHVHKLACHGACEADSFLPWCRNYNVRACENVLPQPITLSPCSKHLRLFLKVVTLANRMNIFYLLVVVVVIVDVVSCFWNREPRRIKYLGPVHTSLTQFTWGQSM